MNTYTADLYIRKAMTVILTAAMFFLLFYSHNVSAAPSRIEVTGEYTMGDSDEKESAIAYARYYARQKAAMQAAAYVEAYNQEHDLGLDKLNVEIATARLIHEVEHNLRWQKTDAQDFHVIVKAVYEVNTDQLAEYVKPANAQYQEDYRINKAQLTGLEQEEARLREELRKNQNSEKAKELTQRLRLNGRMFMAIGYADEALQAANRGQLR